MRYVGGTFESPSQSDVHLEVVCEDSIGWSQRDVNTDLQSLPLKGGCNRTVPKPYLFTLQGIRFERKQNPRNRVKEWKEKKLWIE